MTKNSSRQSYLLKSYFATIFKYFGVKTIIVFAFFVLGTVLGLIIATQIEEIEITILQDNALLAFLSLEYGFISLFLIYLLQYTLLICYAIFVNHNTLLHIINICIIVVFGYIVGFNFIILISTINFVSVIIAIVLYPIFHLVTILIVSFIVAISWHRNCEVRKFGRCRNPLICNNAKLLYCIPIILIIVLQFVYCLLLNIFHMFVVIE